MKIKLLLSFLVFVLLMPIYVKAETVNEEKLKNLNVKEWHEQGYTGKGVKILLSDNGKVWEDFPGFNGKVVVLNKRNLSNSPTNDHAMSSAQILHLIAPDAEIYVTQFPDMKEAIYYDYQIVSSSNVSSLEHMNDVAAENNNQFARAYSKGIFMGNAIGNNSMSSYNAWAESPYWWSTGAVEKYNDVLERVSYSSTSEYLKSVSYTNFDITHFKDGEQTTMPYGGTSSSSPALNGMVALYYQYYKQQHGTFPSVDNVREFIITNSEDLGLYGHDSEFGNGLFKLPKITKDEEYHEEQKFCNIVTLPINEFSVEMVRPDGVTRYVHIDYVYEYIQEKGYTLKYCG